MQRNILSLLLPFGLLTSILFGGCKEPELVGLEVLPDDAYDVAWLDTFTLEVSTLRADSVNTSNTGSPNFLLGEMNDPELGIARAEFFSQFNLPSSNLTFDAESEIDSIVLNIPYSGAYGDVSKWGGTQRFGVYLLTETIDNSTNYYSNSVRPYGSDPVAQVTVRPNFLQGISLVDSLPALPPSLRIRLDDALGQSILDAEPLTVLNSDTSFTKVFYGLAIVPENTGISVGQGAILTLNLSSTASRVELYYRDPAAKELMFPINSASAAHSVFMHDYPLNISSALGDETAGSQEAYVQSMAGLRVRVRIPFIRNLRDSGAVAINRAELVLPLQDGDFSKFGVPPSLEGRVKIDSSETIFVPLGNDDPLVSFGGELNAANAEYVFNVARQVQRIIDNPEPYVEEVFYIQVPNMATNARRAVFNGPMAGERPMKLRITYTIIE